MSQVYCSREDVKVVWDPEKLGDEYLFGVAHCVSCGLIEPVNEWSGPDLGDFLKKHCASEQF